MIRLVGALYGCTGQEPVTEAPIEDPPPVAIPQRTGLKVPPTFELLGAEVPSSPASIVIISLDTVRADRLAVWRLYASS